MATQIRFSYKGVDYTLEYTRRTVEAMERSGFTVDSVTEHPLLSIPTLFFGAFRAHHRHVKRELSDEIFGSIGNKSELLTKLLQMYYEPMEALLEDKDDDEGNIKWETGD